MVRPVCISTLFAPRHSGRSLGRKYARSTRDAKLFFQPGKGFDDSAMPQKPANALLKFRAVSDRTRLRILHLLLGGEMCVCDLVDTIKIPQPTASRHLAYLRRAGLVAAEKRGLWMYYSLVPAQTGFHKNLIDCVAACFEEVPELRRDKARLAKLKQSDRCC
jgi:ArsR family transcriptional regulator